MIDINKLADQIANKLASYINPDDTQQPKKLIARIIKQQYNELVQEYASTINQTTMLPWPTNDQEPTKQQDEINNLGREVNRLNREVNRLNIELNCLVRMLRQTGYGQGQIDAYVANSEELDELKNHIHKTRDILNVSGIVQHANAPDGITIYTRTNTEANTLYHLIVKIAANQY